MLGTLRAKVAIILLLLPYASSAQVDLPGPNLSIWSFTTNEESFKKFAEQFYIEMNSTISALPCVKVVTRRELASYLKDVRREDKVAEIVKKFTSIEPESPEKLKFLRATTVVHGQLLVDDESGTVKIVVKYQFFTGEVVTISEEVVKHHVRSPNNVKAIVGKMTKDLCPARSPLPRNMEFGFSINKVSKSGDYSLHLAADYPLMLLGRPSVGLDLGLIRTMYDESYNTLPGVNTTSTELAATDYYAAGSFKIAPVTIKKAKAIPFLGISIGRPRFTQFIVGSQFYLSKRIAFGVEYRSFRFESTRREVRFNPYGDANRIGTPQMVSYSSFGINFSFKN